MANIETLEARSAFREFSEVQTPQLRISSRDDLWLVSFAAYRSTLPAVLEAIQTTYAVELPQAPTSVTSGDVSFLWAGPQRWLAVAARDQVKDLEQDLLNILSSNAAITDQSDGQAVLQISGNRARDVLSKCVSVDLHPSAFGENDVAITQISHIGATVWQTDNAPTYQIGVFRSFADSFAHDILAAAKEYVG